ncbi:SCY1-like protein 1 [Fistulifera solaris]|uniref:SCY1-like protein 1 n=1 Tax=Fistulifera solaris TaxID=1519565 RepID=A0A1Z5JFM6_FISSO|nr:SCY1-like protein 1 [Fistulifera solaris]|eukprot:GAX12817.1 SCY1-like protein 1 [Fistulifera solaris]
MGNAATSLPYAIGNPVSTTKDGWALHVGSRKSDNAAVSVFVAKKPALQKASQLTPALHHFHHCKRLRHPHILQVYATLDTDNPTEQGSAPPTTKTTETGDLIVVTEPCIPLEAWLQTRPPPEQVAWGLESVVRALHFLHASANLAHGNVSPQSFYVTPAGDVKLWNFSLVTTIEDGQLSRHFKEWEGRLTPQPYRSPERHENRWDALAAAGIHAMDTYSVAVLVSDFFGGTIPTPLVKACQRMQTPNLKLRPRLQPLLKCPLFDTPYQKLQLQLEEFTVQPVEQKIAFWQNLTPSMQAGLLPQELAVYKLLPIIQQTITTLCQSDALKSQDMYRREVLATIPPLFFIAEAYLGNKTSQELGPMVAILFEMNDRAIRGSLLQKTAFLLQHLDNQMLNQSVFGPACGGFSDSSPTLRELTLKATVEIMPKLTQPNLEKLSRYLVRLQSDPEQGIRTNTVIVFGKLAPFLTEVSRQKLLLPAFARALKDPFIPCRLSALKCLLKVKQFFTPAEIAGKVLPAVSPFLLDGSKDVRKEAFLVLDDFLFSLKQESEKMGDAKPMPAPGQAAPQAPPPQPKAAAPVAPAPSSGGYLSGLSSWVTSSAKPTEPPPVAAPQPVAPHPPPRSAPPPQTVASLQINDIDLSDGWGDEDDALDQIKTEISPVAQAKIQFVSPPPLPPAPGGEDDFFGSFNASKPAVKSSLGMPKGKLAVPKQSISLAPKPAIKKLSVDDDMEDGWDDF